MEPVDEHLAGVLHGVGAGFIPGFGAAQVGIDICAREAAHVHARDRHIERGAAAIHIHEAHGGVDAMRTAAQMTQVIVTSQSPDLLDDKDISDDWVFSVVSEKGETKIGPLNEADRSLMRDRLFTAGELLKQGQLHPDLEAIRQIPPEQLELFGGQA